LLFFIVGCRNCYTWIKTSSTVNEWAKMAHLKWVNFDSWKKQEFFPFTTTLYRVAVHTVFSTICLLVLGIQGPESICPLASTKYWDLERIWFYLKSLCILLLCGGYTQVPLYLYAWLTLHGQVNIVSCVILFIKCWYKNSLQYFSTFDSFLSCLACLIIV